MAEFVITYDLHHRREYTGVYRLMAAWKAERLTDSQWLVSLSLDVGQIIDFVAGHLDADDSVAVLELRPNANWATKNVPPAANAWLGHHIAPIQIAA